MRTRGRLTPRVSLARQRPEFDGQGRRVCAQCGDFVDPKDWCPACVAANGPCGKPHRRDRKRADAAFCDDACRALRRSSFIRDCL